ncbi:MAG: efflux RND transporter permease subunit [Ignavibacteria bacterium]|nr:efflux RND transporter permease subunit [Ignavibacteria bacterium]
MAGLLFESGTAVSRRSCRGRFRRWFVKQYQIDIDPNRLSAYGIGINDIVMAVHRSNKDVGGRNIESSDIEYFVRGKGYITDVSDIEEITLKTGQSGNPVKIRDVATVQIHGGT